MRGYRVVLLGPPAKGARVLAALARSIGCPVAVLAERLAHPPFTLEGQFDRVAALRIQAQLEAAGVPCLVEPLPDESPAVATAGRAALEIRSPPLSPPPPLGPLGVRLVLGVALSLFVVGGSLRDRLPPQTALLPVLAEEPEQQAVDLPPFETEVGGVLYTIEPLYRYRIQGLVVTRHDSSHWMDYVHARWNDHLNVVDLCVVWGVNADRTLLDEIEFSSGQFTCYFQTDSRAVYQRFDQSRISNNHLLTDDAKIADTLRQVRVGDQLQIDGYLVKYRHNHDGQPFERGTSIRRDDTGNGACETLFVTELTPLRYGSRFWRLLMGLGWLLLGVGGWLWWRLPPRLH